MCCSFTFVRSDLHHTYQCKEAGEQEESAHINIEHIGKDTVLHPLHTGVDVENLVDDTIISPWPTVSGEQGCKGGRPIA